MLPTRFSLGWWVGNAMYMCLKSSWVVLLFVYPFHFPLAWWHGSFVNDVKFGCPTSDSVHRPVVCQHKIHEGVSTLAQISGLSLTPFSSLLDSSDIILADVLITFTVSQSVLSPVLLLSLPIRETRSTYKYEPRDSFYCKCFEDFFARVKLPGFFTQKKSF